MNPTVSSPPSPPLSERQREALISLLADEDPSIYQTVRARLLSFGPVAGEWLRPHILSRDPVLRRRACEIAQHLARQAADQRFLRFCQRRSEELDLEEGVWLMAQTQYPDVNIEAYRALLDSYALELRGRVDPASHPEANLLAINQCLFQRLGFRGNEQRYYDPDNSYLNRVVDSRVGNPISLCAIYMMVARRLDLVVTGLGLPGHFLCRHQTSICEIYIDCFNQGRFLTKVDCRRYLLRQGSARHETYLTPLSPRQILLRMCANLHQIYLRLELESDASRFQRYLTALGK